MGADDIKLIPAKLVILCSSYFDKLGHPIFANKIKAELSERFIYGVEVRGIATSSEECVRWLSTEFFPVNVICGSYYNIAARSDINQRFRRAGLFISFFVRLISIGHFYWKNYKSLDVGMQVIDLECEPIQAAFASIFISVKSDVQISFVIHSMPEESRSVLMKAYKSLSVIAIRFLLRARGRRAIFMNAAALESAVNKGVPREQCVLGGWGYDMLPSNQVSVDRPSGDLTIVLAFGVLRKDKRIEELVDLFLALDDPSLLLRLAGKSVDVDVLQLRKRIGDNYSRTNIEISDSYVEEEKIANLFADSHMIVLSHSAEFESMSGPMFLAIQYDRPILCFSSNTVAKLVQESESGLVLRFDDTLVSIRSAIATLRDWQYDRVSLSRFTWRAIADRIVAGI